ncbi:hypothetical protein PVL29_017455 [Vitis rotundifolia]|uniref:Uncharacterized protein n=1 Tax=Vitis rotundifolia TaxID=103349 RepID=A0AA38ZAH4_VITRO|nr:hypothetical protein PVL29_017455 [Vitis rotundifolia]
MRSLKSLKGLRIWGFPGVESFPDGDLPPNLTSLLVGRCHNLETPAFEWGLHTLTSLSQLTVWGMYPRMVSFSDDGCLLPISLTSLTISGMESRASLALQNLISLQVLNISYCPNLRSLGLLPATLERLESNDYPMLKERGLKDKGEYWTNIAHIPCIELDGEHIHQLKYNTWRLKCTNFVG